MIRRVVIEHWKSIEKLDLELGPLTVLVGPNGSGKSNFIDALRFVRDAVTHGFDRAVSDRHGLESIRQWSKAEHHEVSMQVEWQGVSSEEVQTGKLSSKDGRVNVHLETRSGDGYLDWESMDEEHLLSLETYVIFPNILRSAQSPANDRRLRASADNLFSIIKRLRDSDGHAERYREILSGMALVLPGLEEIEIQSGGGFVFPVFRMREPGGAEHEFNVSQISDGTLRVLGLLTALYQPEPPDVIALEEPEQTVHPGILSFLAEAIREVSREHQIIVSTHSPHLVDHFEADEILTVELRDGVTRIQPIAEHQKQAVKDHLFTLGELMAVEGLYG